MITLNYDKMMFKEMSQSYLNCFQKGLRKEICGVTYFPLVLFSNGVESGVCKIGVAYICKISWWAIDRR